MVAWPTADAPWKPLVEGLKETPGDNRRKFTSDSSRTLLRPKYSARVDNLVVYIMWTEAQYAEALDFYTVTLAQGSLPFTAPHPRTGVDTEFTFVEPLNFEYVGFLKCRAMLSLEFVL